MDMDQVVFAVSGNTILSMVGLIGAVIALIVYLTKGVHWFDDVTGAKSALDKYKKEATEKMTTLEKKHDTDIAAIKEEQQIIIFGLLACLKGIQGENDAHIAEAISKIEKHLNNQAHK